MIDYSYLIQTTPSGERCAQIGDENYHQRSKIEAIAYIEQLTRTFGAPPRGAYFKVVRCVHELGYYRDIKFYYDPEDQLHVSFLDQLECGCEKWDAMALDELKAAGY